MIEFGKLEYYLLVVNAIGALAYLINLLLYRHTANGRIDVIVTIVSLLGGSAGMLLMILLFDRKAEKENMMFRVFIICIFIIQVIMLLIFKGHHAEHFTFAFWKFFAEHRILLIYLGIMNLVTFIVFAIDKANARANRSRIKIVTLLGIIICRRICGRTRFYVSVPTQDTKGLLYGWNAADNCDAGCCFVLSNECGVVE